MYTHYLVACLIAALAMPVSVIAMSIDDEIEAQEQAQGQVMQYEDEDDADNAMNTPDYDPNIDSGDIDEDDSDTQD